jgi:hypothetical protein
MSSSLDPGSTPGISTSLRPTGFGWRRQRKPVVGEVRRAIARLRRAKAKRSQPGATNPELRQPGATDLRMTPPPGAIYFYHKIFFRIIVTIPFFHRINKC